MTADACIVCGACDPKLLYRSTFQGELNDAPSYFLAHREATAHGRIVRCGTCGFVFTSPRFSPADYDWIYGQIPVPHEGVAAFDPAKAARARRLAEIIRIYFPDGGRFVDFGCGDGTFLREMNDSRGIGFEIGDPGEGEAGPSRIVVGSWHEFVGSADAPLGAFDFVTAFDVFEHLPRIEEDVTLLRKLLRPGGMLFATVPNSASLMAKLTGRYWSMLLLEHLWYFDPRTLSRFLARHGFETVTSRSIPFDAPISHIASRLAQGIGIRRTFQPRGLGRISLPVPAGIMLGVYRAV